MKTLFILATLSSLLGFAEPPREIPRDLYNDYTLNGKITVSSMYFNNSYPPTEAIIYTKKEIDLNISQILQKKTFYYGSTDRYLYEALDKYSNFIKGKVVGIIGSATPLYESIILCWGGKPVSVDYNKIVSEHPNITTMTVEEYEKNPIVFDTLLSISSLEHDGLGRYGDPLNPTADIQTMKKLKSMVKKEGILIFAVPIGVDHIFWNAHRVYGKLRLPLLLEEWNTIDTFGYSNNDLNNASSGGWHQPIFILTPKQKI
ncbi:MAG: DUF268 domain-containing protein [Chlamydiae bacterium]|nr:DUF268 domain-containing protein [Chlamydiota bacterium]